MNEGIEQLISVAIKNHTPEELALGWVRYEVVRTMNARQFGEMCKRNLSGENFDNMITAAIQDWQLVRGSSPS